MKCVERLIIVSLFLLSASVSAKGYIEAEMIEREKTIQAHISKKCGKIKNAVVEYDCIQKEQRKLKQKYPDRGSPEYAKQAYGHLNDLQAKKKVEELFSNAKQARQVLGINERRQPGEVTKSQLEAEAIWIIKNVLKKEPFDIRYRYH